MGATFAFLEEGPAHLVSNFTNERVLVVADSDSEASVLRSILEPLRIQVTHAGSLEEVRQNLKRDYAFVLLAADAPSFDSSDIVRLIRSERAFAGRPILFLTDSPSRIQTLMCDGERETSDLAFRPIDPVLLRAKARLFLELHRSAARVHGLTEQLRASEHTSLRLQSKVAFSDRLLELRSRTQSMEAILHTTLPLLGDAAVLTLLENGGIRKWQVNAALLGSHKWDLGDWRLEMIPADVIRTATALTLLEGSPAMSGREDPNIGLLRELGVSGCLCLPLTANGRILGAITFLKALPDGYHTSEDLKLAEELGQQLALTLDHLRVQEAANRERAGLEASSRAKDAFLATLSHELRTPLNAIVGWANILASGEVDGSRRAHAIETIGRNARALASLVSDLVDRNNSAPRHSGPGVPADHADLPTELLAGLHALVVEDDPDSSELVEAILRRFGADVTCVATVRAALGALAVRRPDVLVSDIGLPDDDGLTLIRRIRGIRELAALPAIALSAYASRRDISQALAAGFQAYIAKPVEPDQLGRIIANVVHG